MNMNSVCCSDIPAFQMLENLYFVGSSRVSVHIIRTSEGLVMLDTGYPDMYEQILDSMAQLALDPRQIVAIIHSHGHIDHFGCTRQFQTISGAKTYISRIDHDILTGKCDLSWARELGYPVPEPFTCDVLVEDGDIFTFGDTEIRCCLTPGHTDGVLSIFVKIPNGEHTVLAGMHGGVGLNTLQTDFLQRYGLPLANRELFRLSLHKVMDEPVELVMGNHPYQNNTVAMLEKRKRGQSVVDPAQWRRFLLSVEQKLDELIAQEK